jgi:hypothetical protein
MQADPFLICAPFWVAGLAVGSALGAGLGMLIGYGLGLRGAPCASRRVTRRNG